jgi:hypothetical protein
MLQGVSDPRPGSGSGTNKQERFSNHKYIEMASQVVKDQEGRAEGKERVFRGTKAGTVGWAACPIHILGEDAPVQIQNQDLAEISRSSKGAP